MNNVDIESQLKRRKHEQAFLFFSFPLDFFHANFAWIDFNFYYIYVVKTLVPAERYLNDHHIV